MDLGGGMEGLVPAKYSRARTSPRFRVLKIAVTPLLLFLGSINIQIDSPEGSREGSPVWQRTEEGEVRIW